MGRFHHEQKKSRGNSSSSNISSKGVSNKKKRELHDDDDDVEDEQVTLTKKNKQGNSSKEEEEEFAEVDDTVRVDKKNPETLLSNALKAAGPSENKSSIRKVIVILEEAKLEPIKTKRGDYELLNVDDHAHILKKNKRDPQEFRPDITHQCLLALLDSPLNKAGHLQVYIRTSQNVVIEVSPNIRIPRTYKRFAGLFVQLLHKLKIRAADGPKTLLKVIKGPVTDHLPPGCRIFGTSETGVLVDVNTFVPALSDSTPVAFVFGAISHGHLEPEYCETQLAISEYALSACVAIGRVMNAFEAKWNIL